MAQIFINQTALTFRLTIGENISDASRVLMRYRKPNGIEGYWTAVIEDAETGIVSYNAVKGLDDTGFWTIWTYIYYNDGTVTTSMPIQFGVYLEGKNYIAFPYGRLSGAAEETDMATEAFEITYDNTNSALVGTNVQDAIDEVDIKIDNFSTPDSEDVVYSNTTSGLSAVNVQAAIDEVDSTTDGIEALLAQSHQLLYVDSSRTDSYVEDGNINRPYKSLASAVSIAAAKAVIKVSAATYSDNIVLAGNVSLIGMGIGKTTLSGTISTGGSGNCSLKEFTSSGTITVFCDTVITNVKSTSSVNIAANVKAYNYDIAATAAHAVSVSSGLVIIENSTISTSANSSAIVHSGGTLVLENIEANNSAASNATVDSSGGSIRILSSILENAGGGYAADIDNGAISTAPNVLTNVINTGGVYAGTAYTVQEGIEGDAPSGSNFSKRPGDQIYYDNSSGLAATDIQAAIDEDLSDYGSGAPGTTPARIGARYYDTNGNVDYVWSGSAWRSIATS